MNNDRPQRFWPGSCVHDVLPPGRTVTLGLQHVLAMYSGAIAVPLILGAALGLSAAQIAMLVSADLFTCGIATLLQTLGLGRLIGIRLPLMMGVTLIALQPMIAIGHHWGLPCVYGAILVSGLLIFLCAGFIGRLYNWFPPVVTGSIVTTIGFGLIPVSASWIAGGAGAPDYGSPHHLLLALGVLLVIVLIARFGRGFWAAIAVLLGMVIGSLAAWWLGDMNLSEVRTAAWLKIPAPFWFGWPQFEPTAIISMTMISLIAAIESMGIFLALAKMANVEIKANDIARGLRAEALATGLGSIFNSFPYITFSQNVGLIAVTKVKSRYVVATGGLILILLGFFPKLGALVAAIAPPVLGGASLVLFGSVAVAGIQLLSTVNFDQPSNQYIAAISIALGMAVSALGAAHLFDGFPASVRMLLSNGVIPCALAAVALHALFSLPIKPAAGR